MLSTLVGFKDFLKSEFLQVEEEVLKPYSSVFPSPITFEDFVWAFGIIRSRTFSGLTGENLTLIPVADLVSYLLLFIHKTIFSLIKCGKSQLKREGIKV